MPIKLSASPAAIKRSPTLGEHTEEILKQVLGYGDEQVAKLLTVGDIVKLVQQLSEEQRGQA